jgi:hypothetical protein
VDPQPGPLFAVSGEDVGLGAALVTAAGLIGAGVMKLWDRWDKKEATNVSRLESLLARTDAELATVKKESRAEMHALRGRCNVVELRLARCETWIRMQPNYPKWVDQPVGMETDTDTHESLPEG